jgi:hypothetical protein
VFKVMFKIKHRYRTLIEVSNVFSRCSFSDVFGIGGHNSLIYLDQKDTFVKLYGKIIQIEKHFINKAIHWPIWLVVKIEHIASSHFCTRPISSMKYILRLPKNEENVLMNFSLETTWMSTENMCESVSTKDVTRIQH